MVHETIDALNKMALLLPSRLDALTHSISADVLTGLERECTKIKGWMAMLEVRLVSTISYFHSTDPPESSHNTSGAAESHTPSEPGMSVGAGASRGG